MGERDLELYLHIPFCMKKCAYCDFLSFVSGRESQRAYKEALIREIGASRMEGRPVTSIYIGGGTPSVLEEDLLSEVMEAVRTNFFITPDAEISMECNPGTVTEKKLRAYRMAGINRISFGLQSAHDGELKSLGRIHTWEEFLESYHLARKIGFANINVDVMSGLPGQTVEGYLDTLRDVVRLGPEHISAYSLILEEGTPFYQMYYDTERELPDEDTERAMYWQGRRFLEAAGYGCYEISNYSRPSWECRHNIGYWTGKEYLGLGLGAASFLDQTRFRNTDSMEAYLEAYLKSAGGRGATRIDEERVTKKRAMEEFAFLGLRMTEGMDTKAFEVRFGCSYWSVYREVTDRFLAMGLLSNREGRVALTEAGVDVSNQIMAEFLLDGE